jgi:hypothetical protein
MQSWATSTSAWAIRDSRQPPRTCVLGHSQPSLRDWSLAHANPGLTSWATLSRPYGTQFGDSGSHTPSKSLFSAACCGTADLSRRAVEAVPFVHKPIAAQQLKSLRENRLPAEHSRNWTGCPTFPPKRGATVQFLLGSAVAQTPPKFNLNPDVICGRAKVMFKPRIAVDLRRMAGFRLAQHGGTTAGRR